MFSWWYAGADWPVGLPGNRPMGPPKIITEFLFFVLILLSNGKLSGPVCPWWNVIFEDVIFKIKLFLDIIELEKRWNTSFYYIFCPRREHSVLNVCSCLVDVVKLCNLACFNFNRRFNVLFTAALGKMAWRESK